MISTRTIKKYSLELITRCYRIEKIRNIVTVLYKPKAPEKWVFILGCYNSGTTLLQTILGLHPQISTLPREGVRFTSVLPQPEDLGWNRMWIKCPDHMKLGNENRAEARQQVIKDWSPWWGSNATVFLEKSITNLTRISWLESNLEPAYFIGIRRNGYCVAEGIRRKAKPTGAAFLGSGLKTYPLDLCAEQWVESNRLLSEASSKLRNYQGITYEDFIKNPVHALTEIFQFLEVSVPELEVENGILKFNDKCIELKNMNNDSFSKLSESEVNQINGVASSDLSRYGYLVQ